MTLKVELARDIIISNVCVKLYYNPSINEGARAMTKYVPYTRTYVRTYTRTYLRTGQTLYPPFTTSLCEGIIISGNLQANWYEYAYVDT